MSVTELANERLLTCAEPLLGELTWDVAPDPYQRLEVDSSELHGDLAPILRLLARRGLEPQLVGVLLDSYPARPFERALLAWDVLRSTLLGKHDGALTERLHRELAPVRDLGPLGAVPVPRDRIVDMIEVVAREAPDANPSMPSLADWARLPATDFDPSGELVTATMAHAKRLARAHFPSLALALLHVVWVRFAMQDALDLMVEIAMDHARADALPLLEDTDPRSLQRGTYASIRLQLSLDDAAQAEAIANMMGVLPGVAEAPRASLLLAKAEIAILKDETLDEATLHAIETHGSPSAEWPYAERVRHLREMTRPHGEAATEVDAWVVSHGNHGHLWKEAARRTKSRPALLQLLSREVRYSSHDPVVWRALAIASSAPAAACQALAKELRKRLGGQLEAAFSSGPRPAVAHPGFMALVEQRRLEALVPIIGPALAELTWEVEPDAEQHATIPGDDEVVLRLMTRRGLEPQLVSTLLDLWSARPAERAVVAFDVARMTLLGNEDGDFIERIRRELHGVQPGGDAEGAAATSKRLSAHVMRLLAEQPAEGDDGARSPKLRALITGRQLDVDAVTILDHARRLSAARLPMLAVTFLHALESHVSGELAEAVRDALVEIQADHRMLVEQPLVPEPDATLMRRRTYEATRQKLENNDIVGAVMWHDIVEEAEESIKGSSDPRLILVKAELTLLKGRIVDAATTARVEAIAAEAPSWRYAARVRDAIAMRSRPDRAPEIMAAFTARFGTDAKLWYRAARHPKMRGELLSLLSREVRHASHDAQVWRALAAFVGEIQAIQGDTAMLQREASQASSIVHP